MYLCSKSHEQDAAPHRLVSPRPVPVSLGVHSWYVHPLSGHYPVSLSLARSWLLSEGIIWNLLVELGTHYFIYLFL